MMPPGPTQLPLANPRLEMLSLQEFLGPIERAGGSMQLVCDRIEKETEEVFAQRLSAFFEPKADLSYSSKENMQMEYGIEHIVRLVDLGYKSLATTKGPPRLHTCPHGAHKDAQTERTGQHLPKQGNNGNAAPTHARAHRIHNELAATLEHSFLQPS